MAIHSSILAWEIPWTEEPGGLQSMGSHESDMTQRLNNSNKMLVRKLYGMIVKKADSSQTAQSGTYWLCEFEQVS